ncbi:hypothetical protein AB0M43_08715 [Longispora sp. NPDC051575]|uniref:hypothetical protein n=1 Tax=Longispora sp. NPDC051575 TaxID=3154943 RepID=UPI0034259AF7
MSDVLRSLAHPEALGRLVAREWGVPVERVTLHRSLANDVYRVDPGHFLKVYRHGWRTPEEVAWECDLVAHLLAEGVPVAPVVGRPGVWHAPEGPGRWSSWNGSPAADRSRRSPPACTGRTAG